MYVIPYKRDATLPLRAAIREVVQNGSNFTRFIYSPRAFQRAIVRKIWIRIAQNQFFPFGCSSVLTLKKPVLNVGKMPSIFFKTSGSAHPITVKSGSAKSLCCLGFRKAHLRIGILMGIRTFILILSTEPE
jgi:hypothetical protein